MVVGDIVESAEVLVIGAGPAGYVAAIRASQLGMDVTLVEKEDIGGVCLNRGCIPSKALIHASSLYQEAGSSEGIGVSASPDLDSVELDRWKEEVVDELTSGVELLEEKYGVDIVRGEARFEDDETVRIVSDEGSESIEFESCIIATGSEPIQLPGAEFDGETIISSRGALQVEELPDSLIVIGGGYIGMELGMAYQKFGVDVKVVEASDQILSQQNSKAAEEVRKKGEELGMEFYTDTRAGSVEKEDGKARVEIGEEALEADQVLVAVGRKPYTGELGLDNTSVETDENGFIETDLSYLAAKNIYAIGDVAGQPMLAHKAFREGKVAAEEVAGEDSVSYNAVPGVVYTDPEIAEVGLSEEGAEEEGYSVGIGKFPNSANGRALTTNDENGFVKLVGDEESGVLLGAVLCGRQASELVGELSLAVESGLTVEDLALTIHPHPTFSEAVMEAAEDFLGRATHRFSG